MNSTEYEKLDEAAVFNAFTLKRNKDWKGDLSKKEWKFAKACRELVDQTLKNYEDKTSETLKEEEKGVTPDAKPKTQKKEVKSKPEEKKSTKPKKAEKAKPKEEKAKPKKKPEPARAAPPKSESVSKGEEDSPFQQAEETKAQKPREEIEMVKAKKEAKSVIEPF